MNQPEFPTVFRGYDPDQVDRHLADLQRGIELAHQEGAERSVELTKARQAHDALLTQVEDQQRVVAGLEERASRVANPTFADLGERIGSMLALADEEAAQIRGDATEAAQVQRLAADEEATGIRSAADTYAQEVRSAADVEAAEAVSRARAEADSIIDDAAREAAARREEAEAYFEKQQANAASAASDFEMTLGERREQSSAEFTTQMANQDQALAAVQERADLLARESEEDRRVAAADAAGHLEAARTEAAGVVNAAKQQAERIRRDSERELAAATARRDSITAQLGNVRSMLATLGGGAAAGRLAQEEHPAAAPESVEQAEQAKQAEQAEQGEAPDAEASDAEVITGTSGSDVEAAAPADGVVEEHDPPRALEPSEDTAEPGQEPDPKTSKGSKKVSTRR
ncbi:MAG: DivIVA domain-containing protein [Ornithinibacter sp.]